MASIPLEITVGSATDLKNVNHFSTMDVYAIVLMEGGPFNSGQKQNTHVAKACGHDPIWNHSMKFTVNKEALLQNLLFLKFEIKSEGKFGDGDIGEVSVSVKELLDEKADQQFKDVSRRVKRPNGKPRGTLNFNYKFGEFAALAEAEKPQAMGFPATAPGYTAAGGSSVCPAPPPHGEEGEAKSVYACRFPPPCGWPASPPPQYEYGYQGYRPPPQEVMKPQKKSGGPKSCGFDF